MQIINSLQFKACLRFAYTVNQFPSPMFVHDEQSIHLDMYVYFFVFKSLVPKLKSMPYRAKCEITFKS